MDQHSVHVDSLSVADDLGYQGQAAVASAVGPQVDYRLIGGHMVRLLQAIFPTERQVPRSTLDADAALEGAEYIGEITDRLIADEFVKHGGNVLRKPVAEEQVIEINLLLPRLDSRRGLFSTYIPGIGQVDTLPELQFAMQCEPLIVDVRAMLTTGETLTYRTRIPHVEAAVVLKAHSWQNRHAEKDLLDLASLLEIREQHEVIPWQLSSRRLIGFRRDTARFLEELANGLPRRSYSRPVPDSLDRRRTAALIKKHVSSR